MPSFLEITPDKLNLIVGTSGAQRLIDVCCQQGRKLGQGAFAYRLSLEVHP
ncbi:MAG: hypothetical protein ACJ8EW_00980 [Rhizobium sp.]|jgi:hypothetical protein|uniref:hypothetical protein n=1 Tax=unclassified Rhizobium TaxID=2613769 RepID=UPI0021A7008A|nr:hypothetical protein [Rhizobium leguminosarum]UWM82491.1 hypothetical protein N2A41_04250 [Rhizobium leguminosarum bv. viciae]